MRTNRQDQVMPAPAGAARPRVHMIVLLLAGFLLMSSALMRNLPLLPDPDEGIFVEAAVRIASSGNPDPGFYGHPGTTLMYPLALGAHLWHAISSQGRVLGADVNLWPHFAAQQWPYYLLGRQLTIAFGLLSIALTLVVARRAFGRWRVALAAAWFLAASPMFVMYARLVRTDSVATFFGMLALYFLLRLLDKPSIAWQIAAGAAIGLAVASRYFMIALIAPLMAVNVAHYLRSRRSGGGDFAWGGALLGLTAIPAFFLLGVPTLLPHFADVIADLRREARSTHLGADGLSYWGNLGWYATLGLPSAVKWPLALGTAAGIIVIAVERKVRPLLLLLYAAVFMLFIAISPLHWQRWMIPILPILMMAAAVALDHLLLWLRRFMPAGMQNPRSIALACGVVAFLLLAWPLGESALMVIRDGGGNTRLIARAWVEENLAPDSRIGQEAYGAFLAGTGYADETIDPLPHAVVSGASVEESLQAWRAAGYDYIVASSFIYNRYFAEPARYPDEIAFYNQLFATGALVKEFAPAWYQSGPVLRIYKP